MMKIVIVVGAATPPGRLNNAAEFLAGAMTRAGKAATEIVNLATAGVEMCDGRLLEQYGESTRSTVRTIDEADAVALAAPVYRASFPGVLKNLLDQLPVPSLRNKPIGIVAMGGSPHHYLAVDGHLRMVLAWFGALVLPTSVYLTGKDFSEGRLASPDASAELTALGQTLLTLAESLGGRDLGPAPMAAKYF